MNLHYSQTLPCGPQKTHEVLIPYEFTLLSNTIVGVVFRMGVLIPYEFTLLSNGYSLFGAGLEVLIPYEFTLLSNLK